MIVDAVDGLDVSSTASLLSFYHSLDKVLRIAVTQRVGDFDIALPDCLPKPTSCQSKWNWTKTSEGASTRQEAE